MNKVYEFYEKFEEFYVIFEVCVSIINFVWDFCNLVINII